MKKKNILVTGTHRSGSTWVGEVLTQSKEMTYIYEPFNLRHKSYYRTPLNYWFEYIGEDVMKQQAFKDYIHYYCEGSIQCLYDRLKNNGLRDYPYILKSEAFKILYKDKRKVFKDPIAFFSADFFYHHFNCEVFVLIRHPAAFAESLKSKDWKHDFTHFLMQPNLMNTMLLPFQNEIKAFVENEEKQNDIIEHAILLWNIFHHQIRAYQKQYESWYFIKHEALSLNPIEEYKSLFQKLDIPFDNKIEKFILESTKSNSLDGENRDSAKNIKKWTTRLSSNEIERIYTGTQQIAQSFYSKEEWFNI